MCEFRSAKDDVCLCFEPLCILTPGNRVALSVITEANYEFAFHCY